MKPPEEQPFTLRSFPTAILHFDADAFFTSVEQALHPEYRGRPVVTGKERNIIACASYEAKALGIKRGVALWDARKACPQLVVLPSDYETYSLYSKRIFEIIRRFTPMVEEHSIDEGFADITGLRRLHRTSYPGIAKNIQATVHAELDITISVGLCPTKMLAKMASKFRKPHGLTAVAGKHIHIFLQRQPLEAVTGFGPNTVALLEKQGLKTAFDFAMRPHAWADRMLGKIGRELWHELRGDPVYAIETEEKTDFITVSKCKTFTAPSRDRAFVFAKLMRNVESACIKLRRYHLRARHLSVVLLEERFEQYGLEARLTRATSAPQELAPLVQPMFEQIFNPERDYRATMVMFGRLEEDRVDQLDLFEDRPRIDRLARAAAAIDEANRIYGKHTVHLGTGLYLDRNTRTSRDEQPARKSDLLHGESRRRRLKFPKLGIDV